MSEKKVTKPVALAVGAALASSFAIGGAAMADDSLENPFQMSTLSATTPRAKAPAATVPAASPTTPRAKAPVAKVPAAKSRKAKALAVKVPAEARRKDRTEAIASPAVPKAHAFARGPFSFRRNTWLPGIPAKTAVFDVTICGLPC